MTEPRLLTKEDIICLGCKFATTYELAEGIKIECNETKGLVLDADVVKFVLQGLLDEIEKRRRFSISHQDKEGYMIVRVDEMNWVEKQIKKYLGAIQEERE